MEVSRINTLSPISFAGKKNREVSFTSTPKADNSGEKIALSLLGLAAVGAAFVVGRKSINVSKLKSAAVKAEEAAFVKGKEAAEAAIKEAEKAGQKIDQVVTKFENKIERFVNGKTKSLTIVDEKTGKVKSYIQYYKNGQTKNEIEYFHGTDMPKTIKEYTKDGKLKYERINGSYYTNDFDLKIYDSNGVIKLQKCTGRGLSGCKTVFVKHFSNEGKLIKKIDTNGSHTFEYSPEGRLIKDSRAWGRNGKRIEIPQYDENGNRISANILELKDGKRFIERECNFADRTQKVKVYDKNGKVVHSSNRTDELIKAGNRKNKSSRINEGAWDEVFENAENKTKTITRPYGQGVTQTRTYDTSSKTPKLKEVTIQHKDGSKKVTEFLEDGKKKVTVYLADGTVKS